MTRSLLCAFALVLAPQAASAQGAAEMMPPIAPPYYQVRYETSDKPGELKMPVTYTLWIPEGVKTLRGVIVHQHGCGKGAGKTGLTAAYDLHWQALAKKWDCALLGPAYHQLTDSDCRNWCDPRNGSDRAFQQALADFGTQSGHPELSNVPWCLWGHSGGGFWSSIMLTLHPERIAAIWFRSGSAFAVWQRGEIPAATPKPESYAVPIMFNGGVKEAEDKKHGPARVGDRAMLKHWLEQGAPAGSAPDPLTGHECGDSRYLAIPFFDVCMKRRLPEAGSGSQVLRPVNRDLAWYTVPGSGVAQAATAFTGNKLESHWLPDESFAKAWESYVKTGRPSDTTPPPAPTEVKVTASGELTWKAETDFESGLAGFIIRRDGKELARLPEKPLTKYGTSLFQGLSHGDTPATAAQAMKFVDPTATSDGKHQYEVIALNAAGLESSASPTVKR